jgi:hypothetical protein
MKHARTFWTLPLAIVLATTIACGGSQDSSAPGQAGPIEYATDALVDTDWIEANSANPSVVLVELGGNTRDYDAGHLPGAVFLGMNGLSNTNNPIEGIIATRDQVSAALSAGWAWPSHSASRSCTVAACARCRRPAVARGCVWRCRWRLVKTAPVYSPRAG